MIYFLKKLSSFTLDDVDNSLREVILPGPSDLRPAKKHKYKHKPNKIHKPLKPNKNHKPFQTVQYSDISEIVDNILNHTTNWYLPGKKKQVKVLVLAYQRTGSSFLAQLLAFGNATYFFEPDYLLLKGEYNLEYRELVSGFLDKIFGCDEPVMKFMKKKKFVSKQQFDCLFPFISKTIRVRLEYIKEWILYREDVKVRAKFTLFTVGL